MEDRKEALNKLVSIVGKDFVSSEPPDLIPYVKDSYSTMMGMNVGLPDFVVLPKTEDEVVQIVRLANEYKIPIYPRSFGVNIAGSALPYQSGGMVIDLKRMDRILEINEDTMTATIEPGVSWGQLRKAAKKKGLDVIPIGGPYETSPVGNHLLTNITLYATKYNCDRAVALRVVLPNGEILRTGSWGSAVGGDINPYFRYAYGPDLTGMFRGSMGNYGIITTMIERLRPMAEVETNIFSAYNDMASCLEAMKKIERLEITRTSFGYNHVFAEHIILSPNRIRNREEREALKKKLPPFILNCGIGGSPEMISLYSKIIEEEVNKTGGKIIDWTQGEYELPPKDIEWMNQSCEGASRGIIHMYSPLSGFAAVIGCLPITNVDEVYHTVKDLVKQYELKDALTGEDLDHQLIIVPFDRCSTVYVEQELLYDPAGPPEYLAQVMKCLRDCYSNIVGKHGATHTIPNKTFMKMLVPAYADILKGFKKMVDPNNIMMPGGPYSLE
ncbi:MAG: hypothetical protein AVO39_10545 [delta proteobacterium MLS_D]|jgi:FAD/FMN-containing dehydrogenase|nr:MAG: hypothetical protein AVO39_10545 [delta proteobacterium MLS_D]